MQVAPDLRSGLRVAQDLEAAAEAAAAFVDGRKRQRACLLQTARGKWRLRKRHRASALVCMVALDKQLRVSACASCRRSRWHRGALRGCGLCCQWPWTQDRTAWQRAPACRGQNLSLIHISEPTRPY